mmetsp:Transcript_9283/g.22089  ORF Transcript_9283/g.22089 Transcript_9283/m.22089 type:complete len:86 (+) Transcript_9283:81-338(+)
MNSRTSTDCNTSTNGTIGPIAAMRIASLPSLRAPISSALHYAPGYDSSSPSKQNTERISAMLDEAIKIVNGDDFLFERSHPELLQ